MRRSATARKARHDARDRSRRAWEGNPVFIVGAAIDGATSITITINGSQVEVPIENNAHGYQAPPDVVATDVTGAVVNFADGHKEEAN